VLLPTGEQLAVTDVAGHTTIRVLFRPPTGISGALTIRRFGGHTLVIPPEAEHYLGVLDESLFDIDRLPDPLQTIPVTFTGTGQAVPGVAISTHEVGSTTRGYLTASSAARFGTALAASWRRTAGTGLRVAPFGLDGMVAGFATGHPATAASTEPTLTVSLVGPDGVPVDGQIGILNTDDASRYSTFVPTVGGSVSVSVPMGHYSLIGDYTSIDPATGHQTVYSAVVNDYLVSQAAQQPALDERDASASPAVQTPRPDRFMFGSTDLEIRDQYNRLDGAGLTDIIGLTPGDSIRLTPVSSRASVGQISRRPSVWPGSLRAERLTPTTSPSTTQATSRPTCTNRWPQPAGHHRGPLLQQAAARRCVLTHLLLPVPELRSLNTVSHTCSGPADRIRQRTCACLMARDPDARCSWADCRCREFRTQLRRGSPLSRGLAAWTARPRLSADCGRSGGLLGLPEDRRPFDRARAGRRYHLRPLRLPA
jgi:hypothetical protein